MKLNYNDQKLLTSKMEIVQTTCALYFKSSEAIHFREQTENVFAFIQICCIRMCCAMFDLNDTDPHIGPHMSCD